MLFTFHCAYLQRWFWLYFFFFRCKDNTQRQLRPQRSMMDIDELVRAETRFPFRPSPTGCAADREPKNPFPNRSPRCRSIFQKWCREENFHLAKWHITLGRLDHRLRLRGHFSAGPGRCGHFAVQTNEHIIKCVVAVIREQELQVELSYFYGRGIRCCKRAEQNRERNLGTIRAMSAPYFVCSKTSSVVQIEFPF